jgi:hypothetical protein
MENMVIPQSSSKKNYFTKETEDAIIQYNNSTDPEERGRLFRDKIHYAFYKLAENLIHTFKFYYTEVENLEDLKHEIVALLVEEKIHKFDSSKGAKAYSYFGTIVKNWLIVYNDKNYKKKIDKSPIEEVKSNESFSYSLDDQKYSGDKLSKFIDAYVEYCTNNIYELFPLDKYTTPPDENAKIADAILELFRKRDNLDVFNKKALYIYIREMIDVKTPKITKVANKLNDIFKKNYVFYLENGYINFDDK